MKKTNGLYSRDTWKLLTAQEILRNVFPAFTQLEESATARLERTSYVISLGHDPRWIIPANTRLVLPVLKSWQPYKFRSRVQWNLVLLSCRAGILSQLPGVASNTSSVDFSYWRERLEGFSDTEEMVIFVGSPSHTRKAIVFFVARDSSVRAVAKLPLYDAAKTAILSEANILRRFQSRQVLPHILFVDDERGIAAQTWMPGKPVSRLLRQEHIELLSELVNNGESTRLCDQRDHIAALIDELDIPLESSLRRRALDLLEDSSELPAFIEHRDFAPWNLRRLPEGGLALIDWEWAVEKSLPWQDVCHFFYIQDYVFRDYGNVWEKLVGNSLLQTYIRRFGIPSKALPGLTMHYLLRILYLDVKNAQVEKTQYTIDQIRLLLQV